MATYVLRSSHTSRSKGSQATRAFAYRSGERIKDDRTGKTHDYSDRRDIAYKEVVLPDDLNNRPDMAWSQNRAILWNAMEFAGTRNNSRTAWEWLVLVRPERQRPEPQPDLGSVWLRKRALALKMCLELGDSARKRRAPLGILTAP